MPESFGARLRQRREEQGIRLLTIAGQTKIKKSLLEALERDDVSYWPAGIYRRAFIRAYARAINLDPDVVVREFLELFPEPPAVDVLTAMASALDHAPRTARPTGLRHVVCSAIGSLSRRRRAPGRDAGVPIAAEPEVPAARPPAPACEPDLLAFSQLCTKFAQAGNASDVQPLLQEAARLLDATGLIVWLWDASAASLKPALVYGYPERVVSRLPWVEPDADNATAATFRSAEACVIRGSQHAKGAVVVPLLTSAACAGVLAIELPRGGEQATPVRAVATILAALLAQMTGRAGAAEARPPTLVARRGRRISGG